MKKSLFLFFILAFLQFQSTYAQYGPSLVSGRPGNANGAGTVGKGILQFQAGLQYAGTTSIFDSTKYDTEFSENLVVRFGLSERFEVSTVLNHITTSTYAPFGEDVKASGFTTTMLRARYRPLNNLAIQVAMNIPVLGNDFERNSVLPQLRVMYNTNFSESLSLTTNLGAQWIAPKENPIGFYVFSFSANLPFDLSLILESYGNFDQMGVRNFYDIGLAYFFKPDLMFDLNAGWGENFGIESYFVTTGFSYRIKTKYRD